MPFVDTIEPLSDILDQNDRRTIFACQYALLVISEAAKRLGPGYQGNWHRLRHAYDMLDSAVSWKVYRDDLPPLKVSVAAALVRLAKPPAAPPAS